MNFYTSDTHFFHKKILEFCPQRVGLDAETMNNAIVSEWNAVVGKNDTVYHLGDFSLGKSEETKQMIQRLNGHKVLVLGNHDRRSAHWYAQAGFTAVFGHHMFVTIGCTNVMLSHYPFKLSWLKMLWYSLVDKGYTRYQDKKNIDNGSCVLLHGHCHNKYYKVLGRAVDVGWDAWGKPVSETEIVKLMEVI